MHAAGRPVVLIGEDALCLALLRRLARHVNGELLEFLAFIEGGSEKVRAGLPRYRNACKQIPHVVLMDLDDWSCPSALRHQWGLTKLPPALLFRLAAREAESWVLADADGFGVADRTALQRALDRLHSPPLEPRPRRRCRAQPGAVAEALG